MVVRENEQKGLNLNINKCYSLVVTKKPQPPNCIVKIKGKDIQQKNSFEYLGSLITSDARSDKEILRRIGIAKAAFASMERVLTSRNINANTRIRVLKCYVWSTLLYGCESWTISHSMKERLEAVELWFLRRMWKIPWTARMSNERVLETARTEKTLMKTVTSRQASFFGHVIRKGEMEHLVTTAKIEGRRARGRQRMTYTESLCGRMDVQKMDMVRAATDRKVWKAMTANVSI